MKEKYKNTEIHLNDYEFLMLSLAAHKKNLTFNEYINYILKEELDKYVKEINKDARNFKKNKIKPSKSKNRQDRRKLSKVT